MSKSSKPHTLVVNVYVKLGPMDVKSIVRNEILVRSPEEVQQALDLVTKEYAIYEGEWAIQPMAKCIYEGTQDVVLGNFNKRAKEVGLLGVWCYTAKRDEPLWSSETVTLAELSAADKSRYSELLDPPAVSVTSKISKVSENTNSETSLISDFSGSADSAGW